jgi:hypothetical protein
MRRTERKRGRTIRGDSETWLVGDLVGDFD